MVENLVEMSYIFLRIQAEFGWKQFMTGGALYGRHIEPVRKKLRFTILGYSETCSQNFMKIGEPCFWTTLHGDTHLKRSTLSLLIVVLFAMKILKPYNMYLID